MRIFLASHDIPQGICLQNTRSAITCSCINVACTSQLFYLFVICIINFLSDLKCLLEVDKLFCVAQYHGRKGIQQGAISSPLLYNNSVLESQKPVKTSFLFRGMDLSMLNYADDILNTSRCLSRIKANFDILSTAYKQIGLSFNTNKSEVVAFCWKGTNSWDRVVKFDVDGFVLSNSIVYLGMSVGSSMVFTRSLQINYFGEKLMVFHHRQKKYSRQIRARLYSALVIPNFLAMSPYWNIFSESDKIQLRSDYYKCAKFSAQFKTVDKECVSVASIRCCRSHCSSH